MMMLLFLSRENDCPVCFRRQVHLGSHPGTLQESGEQLLLLFQGLVAAMARGQLLPHGPQLGFQDDTAQDVAKSGSYSSPC
jgi:hypothetical protein